VRNPQLLRAAQFVAAALVLWAAASVIIDAVRDWSLSDIDAYWNAALRLRAGDDLYVRSYSVGAHDLFRYAPWFAFAWVPLTFLPREAVEVGWTAVLLAAAAYAVGPAVRGRTFAGILIAILMSAYLFWTTAKGNAQPLIVASLLYGVRHRSGPIWVALAASLKAAPLVLVAVYAGRGEWRKVVWTVLLTATLVAPMLLFDLTDYPRAPGLSDALFYLVNPGAWFVIALLAAVVAFRAARTRFAWLSGAVAVIAAFPRLLDYDTTFLLLGAADEERVRREESRAAAAGRT
jgi:hypothetical protein